MTGCHGNGPAYITKVEGHSLSEAAGSDCHFTRASCQRTLTAVRTLREGKEEVKEEGRKRRSKGRERREGKGSESCQDRRVYSLEQKRVPQEPPPPWRVGQSYHHCTVLGPSWEPMIIINTL